VGLDVAGPKPLYLQLHDTLLRMIERGEYAPHQRLPSERELSRRFMVSRITVRQALADLTQEGRVYSKVGKGTYVSDPLARRPLGSLFGFSESVHRQGRNPGSVILEAGLLEASEAIASSLQIPEGTETVRFYRLRKADGIPVVLEATHLPHAVCPGLLQRMADDVSLYTVLEQAYGLRMASAEVTMGAGLADESEARLLELTLPTAVLRMEQTSFVEDGRPMEFTRSTYRGEGYRFTATLYRGERPFWHPVENAAIPSGLGSGR
jgi:GntR family transcriptional regulator